MSRSTRCSRACGSTRTNLILPPRLQLLLRLLFTATGRMHGCTLPLLLIHRIPRSPRTTLVWARRIEQRSWPGTRAILLHHRCYRLHGEGLMTAYHDRCQSDNREEGMRETCTMSGCLGEGTKPGVMFFAQFLPLLLFSQSLAFSHFLSLFWCTFLLLVRHLKPHHHLTIPG